MELGNSVKPSVTFVLSFHLVFCSSDVLFPAVYTWSDNKVHELIAVKLQHTSLLNIAVVAFKILPLRPNAPIQAPNPPFKTILELVLWNGLQTYRRINS
jgi:hypothetical protein